jgi:hypothetical protein
VAKSELLGLERRHDATHGKLIRLIQKAVEIDSETCADGADGRRAPIIDKGAGFDALAQRLDDEDVLAAATLQPGLAEPHAGKVARDQQPAFEFGGADGAALRERRQSRPDKARISFHFHVVDPTFVQDDGKNSVRYPLLGHPCGCEAEAGRAGDVGDVGCKPLEILGRKGAAHVILDDGSKGGWGQHGRAAHPDGSDEDGAFDVAAVDARARDGDARAGSWTSPLVLPQLVLDDGRIRPIDWRLIGSDARRQDAKRQCDRRTNLPQEPQSHQKTRSLSEFS